MDSGNNTDVKIVASQFLEEKSYWLDLLSRDIEQRGFKDKITSAGPVTKSYNKLFADETSSNLLKICKGHMPNVQIILTSALSAVLSRYSNNKDVLIGTTIDKQEENQTFINTILPLRLSVDETSTFKNHIMHVKGVINEAIEHQNYPIKHLVEYDLNIESNKSDFGLFDVALILNDLHDKKYLKDISVNIVVNVLIVDSKVSLEIEYNNSKYSENEIVLIADHFEELLKNGLSNSAELLSNLEMLTPIEKDVLLNGFNNTAKEYPNDKTVFELFEKQVLQFPNEIAIECKEESVSFQNLNKYANQIANNLVKRGVKSDSHVVVMLDRSVDLVASILGIWKSLGVYLPLDTDYPTERVSDILKDSGAKVLITYSNCVNAELEENFEGEIILIDEDKELICQEADSNPGLKPNLEDTAYIIYTSGSTGKPKGVMVEHQGMINHLFAKINDLSITKETILIQNASQTFDISIWQFFASMVSGGKTVIFPHEYIFDIQLFIENVTKSKATILEVVPSYLEALLEALTVNKTTLEHLQYIIVTGEAVLPILINRWFEQYPNIPVLNAYGPTEASDDITHCFMDKTIEGDIVSIGKPVQNTNIYIVNDYMQLCPVGVKGEICVAGICVGKGYLNDEEKTKKAFSDDPFKDWDYRLYKTGDEGYWTSDGEIVFLGRKDYQVKINGFRIELGDIERNLRQLEDVDEAVVVDRADGEGKKFLCAFLKSQETLTITNIKSALGEKLPKYMIPAYFSQLNEMPLTKNGKIDRKLLQNSKNKDSDFIAFIEEDNLVNFISKDHLDDSKVEPEINSKEYSISEEEKKKLVTEFNNTEFAIDEEVVIHELIEKQAKATPNKIALTINNASLTYHQLNEQANIFANNLIKKGVKQDEVVGLMISRSLEMITGLLGILKAGAAYLPLGKENPIERIKYMIQDCKVNVIVTDDSESLQELNCDIMHVNDCVADEKSILNPAKSCFSNNLALIIYTSGTTGNPKGVMIEHKAFINFFTYMIDKVGFKSTDSIVSITTVSFDIFVTEVLLPLTRGMRVVLGDEIVQGDPSEVTALMKKECVSYFQSTPTTLAKVLTGNTNEAFRDLDTVLSCGELFPPNLYLKLEKATNGKIINMYGPAETTVQSSLKIVDCVENLNIGVPFYNTQIYMLNENRQLCPVNEVGELYIGGLGLARGYYGNEELTNEKFVPNPFIPGERMYQTGDMAKWLPNGEIDFAGRVDHQIKIDGIRIEINEIVNTILQFPDIDDVVVVKNKTLRIENTLCAFIIAKGRVLENDLRTFLSEKLPMYMIPSYFVQLSKIPITVNGKTNRKLLESIEVDVDETYFAPTNEYEEKLVEIWQTSLKPRKKIGIRDNFFNIGGDSIKSISLISKMNLEFGIKLKIYDLLRNETIEKINLVIQEKLIENEDDEAEREQVIDEMEGMKDSFMAELNN